MSVRSNSRSEPCAHTNSYPTNHEEPASLHEGSSATLSHESSPTEQTNMSADNSSSSSLVHAPVRRTSTQPASAYQMAIFTSNCADEDSVIQRDAATPAERSFMRLHGCRRRRFNRALDSHHPMSDQSMSFVTTSTLPSMHLDPGASRSYGPGSSISTPINTAVSFSPNTSTYKYTGAHWTSMPHEKYFGSHVKHGPPHRSVRNVSVLSPTGQESFSSSSSSTATATATAAAAAGTVNLVSHSIAHTPPRMGRASTTTTSHDGARHGTNDNAPPSARIAAIHTPDGVTANGMRTCRDTAQTEAARTSPMHSPRSRHASVGPHHSTLLEIYPPADDPASPRIIADRTLLPVRAEDAEDEEEYVDEAYTHARVVAAAAVARRLPLDPSKPPPLTEPQAQLSLCSPRSPARASATASTPPYAHSHHHKQQQQQHSLVGRSGSGVTHTAPPATHGESHGMHTIRVDGEEDHAVAAACGWDAFHHSVLFDLHESQSTAHKSSTTTHPTASSASLAPSLNTWRFPYLGKWAESGVCGESAVASAGEEERRGGRGGGVGGGVDHRRRTTPLAGAKEKADAPRAVEAGHDSTWSASLRHTTCEAAKANVQTTEAITTRASVSPPQGREQAVRPTRRRGTSGPERGGTRSGNYIVSIMKTTPTFRSIAHDREETSPRRHGRRGSVWGGEADSLSPSPGGGGGGRRLLTPPSASTFYAPGGASGCGGCHVRQRRTRVHEKAAAAAAHTHTHHGTWEEDDDAARHGGEREDGVTVHAHTDGHARPPVSQRNVHVSPGTEEVEEGGWRMGKTGEVREAVPTTSFAMSPPKGQENDIHDSSHTTGTKREKEEVWTSSSRKGGDLPVRPTPPSRAPMPPTLPAMSASTILGGSVHGERVHPPSRHDGKEHDGDRTPLPFVLAAHTHASCMEATVCFDDDEFHGHTVEAVLAGYLRRTDRARVHPAAGTTLSRLTHADRTESPPQPPASVWNAALGPTEDSLIDLGTALRPVLLSTASSPRTRVSDACAQAETRIRMRRAASASPTSSSCASGVTTSPARARSGGGGRRGRGGGPSLPPSPRAAEDQQRVGWAAVSLSEATTALWPHPTYTQSHSPLSHSTEYYSLAPHLHEDTTCRNITTRVPLPVRSGALVHHLLSSRTSLTRPASVRHEREGVGGGEGAVTTMAIRGTCECGGGDVCKGAEAEEGPVTAAALCTAVTRAHSPGSGVREAAEEPSPCAALLLRRIRERPLMQTTLFLAQAMRRHAAMCAGGRRRRQTASVSPSPSRRREEVEEEEKGGGGGGGGGNVRRESRVMFVDVAPKEAAKADAEDRESRPTHAERRRVTTPHAVMGVTSMTLFPSPPPRIKQGEEHEQGGDERRQEEATTRSVEEGGCPVLTDADEGELTLSSPCYVLSFNAAAPLHLSPSGAEEEEEEDEEESSEGPPPCPLQPPTRRRYWNKEDDHSDHPHKDHPYEEKATETDAAAVVALEASLTRSEEGVHVVNVPPTVIHAAESSLTGRMCASVRDDATASVCLLDDKKVGGGDRGEEEKEKDDDEAAAASGAGEEERVAAAAGASVRTQHPSEAYLPAHFHRTLTADAHLIRHTHSIDHMEREVDNAAGDLVVSVGMRLMGWLEVVELLGSGSFGQVFLCKDLRICHGYFVHPRDIDGEDFAYWNCSHHYLPYGDCNAMPTHAPLVAVKVVKSIPLFESQSVLEAEMLVLIGAQVRRNNGNDDHHRDGGDHGANGEETRTRPAARADGVEEHRSASEMSAEPPALDPRSRHIAKVLADGICYGHHCIVLERYGANLYEYMESNHYRGLPMYQIRSIGVQLLSALSMLHENCHIIHADVKPENMLLTLDSCRNRLLTSIASSQPPPPAPPAPPSPSQPRTEEGGGLQGMALHTTHSSSSSSATLRESSLIAHMSGGRLRSRGVGLGNAGGSISISSNYVVVEGGVGGGCEEMTSMSSLRRRSFVNLTTSASFAVPDPVRVQALTQPTLVSSRRQRRTTTAALETSSASSVTLGKTIRRRRSEEADREPEPEQEVSLGEAAMSRCSGGYGCSGGGSGSPVPVAQLRIKLIDFSSSCYTGQKCFSYIQSRYYRAPEVILGAPYDERIDMWSTGCVLAELLLGMPLLAGCNEHHQLALVEGMIGPLPVSMLTQGSNTSWYYHYELPSAAGCDAAVGAVAEVGAAEAAAVPSGGRYVLLSREEYFAQQQSEPQPYTRLFTYDALQTLIRHCPLSVEERRMSRGMNPYAEMATTPTGDGVAEDFMMMMGGAKDEVMAAIRSELIHQRFLFYDLLCGLLQTDPANRLTATQALQHPFFCKALSYTAQFRLDA